MLARMAVGIKRDECLVASAGVLSTTRIGYLFKMPFNVMRI